jgi:hypothetical protein
MVNGSDDDSSSDEESDVDEVEVSVTGEVQQEEPVRKGKREVEGEKEE